MASTSEIQNAALQFASSAQTEMQGFAQAAANFAFTPIDISAAWTAPASVLGYNGGLVPAPRDITVPPISASRPTAPSLDSLPTITAPSIPELIAAEPVITLPSAPSTALPSAPGAAPEFNAPAVPDAPKLTLPDVPTFTAVEIPVAPALENVAFSGVLEGDNLTAPTERFAYAEQEYKSALLDSLKAKLLKDLVDGGYGIETADEEGLWERTREREARNAEATIQEAIRQAAARGMMMPPGALNAVIARAQQEALAKISSVSRDIALKRADMYVENRKFTMAEVRQLEEMLQRMFAAMMERTLNAAKALVELGIAVFNAQLAKHNYRLERFKAEASVYEALIRGQLAKVEQYKAQVEGAKLSADVQRIHADVYRTQLEGVNALINIYRTEMEAAKVAAEIEQLKLQGFKTTVDAYTAQVGAKTAEFGMYEASIKGQMAKVNIYESQVRAFGASVDAYKARVEAQDVIVRTQVAANQSKLEAYKADISRYSAELSASQAELSGAIAKYDADVRKYTVTVDGAIRSSQQNVEAGKANAQIAIANASMLSSAAIHAGQVLAAQATASGQTMAHVASAFGTAAAGAMSAATGLEATIVSK